MVSTSGSRASTVRLIGGRPCLDLVNTVSWRGDPARLEEHLTDSAAALVWSVRAGVLTDSEAAALAGLDVRRPLLALRRAVTAHLADLPEPDVQALQPVVDSALRASALVPGPDGAAWEVKALDARTPARRIALDLLDQLTSPPGPVRRCGDPDCGWAYVDTSRGHRRTWCSSADCGNRERVRRHAARSVEVQVSPVDR